MVHNRLENSVVSARPDDSEKRVQSYRRRTVDKVVPYKGVTFYKRTGRWESNIWYNNKQHYLGASFTALEAARAYDKAVLFTRSSTEELNFHPSSYEEDIQQMKGMSFVTYRQHLREISRQAKCQIINESYKGILIDQNGRWEVKYSLKNGSKPTYLLVGWYDTEEAALRAYNETALRYGGPRATIKSFHQTRRDSTRSLRNTASRYTMPKNTTNMMVLTGGTEGDVPVLTDDDLRPTCDLIDVPITMEQLPPLSATHPTVNYGLLDLAVATDEDESLEEPPSLSSIVRRQTQGLTHAREELPLFHGIEGSDSSDSPVISCTMYTWLIEEYQKHEKNRVTLSIADSSRLIQNPGQVQSGSTYFAPPLNRDTWTADLSHLKVMPPFDVNISLSAK